MKKTMLMAALLCATASSAAETETISYNLNEFKDEVVVPCETDKCGKYAKVNVKQLGCAHDAYENYRYVNIRK